MLHVTFHINTVCAIVFLSYTLSITLQNCIKMALFITTFLPQYSVSDFEDYFNCFNPVAKCTTRSQAVKYAKQVALSRKCWKAETWLLEILRGSDIWLIEYCHFNDLDGQCSFFSSVQKIRIRLHSSYDLLFTALDFHHCRLEQESHSLPSLALIYPPVNLT